MKKIRKIEHCLETWWNPKGKHSVKAKSKIRHTVRERTIPILLSLPSIIIAKLGLLAYPRCCILQDDLKEKQGNSRNGSAEQQDSCSQQYFAGIGWCKNDLHIGRACVTHWTHKKRSLNIFILIMTLTRTFMVL